MCTNNSNCTNSDNTCGCGISTDQVSYQGPTLPCVEINNCDTMTTVLQQLNSYICSDELVHTIINNIITNISLYQQFTTLVNQTVDCETVLACNSTTTTTTLAPCESFSLNNTGETPVAIIITDCITHLQEAIILNPGNTNICVVTNSPLVVPGTVIAIPNGPCGTTTTTSTSSTTTTTTTAIPCECLTAINEDSISHTISYTDCFGVFLENDIDIPPYETIKFCGCCAYSDSSFVTISIGENCIDQICPTTTTTTTLI
jgi:hypothetical protein